jgi:1-acyl-sn-glycerol-3-phosphate acyltransferase
VPDDSSRAAAPATWEPFDPEWCRSTLEDVLDPLIDQWFRPQLFAGHNIPEHGPVILACNHSGTALPYDAVVLDGFLWHRDGYAPERKLRTVFEPALARHWWLRPFGLRDFWRRAGAVDMTFDNFERLLERGDRVLYFPEGVPGIGKGFQNRYRLQPFKTSFVLLAHRHGVPVVPIYTVNAEWVMPFHFTLRPIDRVMQRFWGVPFLPLPAGLLAILIPWLWFLALPAHMVFVCGEPIDVRALLAAAGVKPGDQPSKQQLRETAERVRQRMQREMTELVAIHGTRPYHWRSLLATIRREGWRFLKVLPPVWPMTFVRHERDRSRPPARNRLHAIVRDLDLVAYLLPLGWPLLTLARRLRRPPYGWRGLTTAERREREGHFLWRLSERPLPPRDRPAPLSAVPAAVRAAYAPPSPATGAPAAP